MHTHTQSMQSMAVCSSSALPTALAGEQPGAAVHHSQQTVPGAQQQVNAPVTGFHPCRCVQGELAH